MSDDRQELSDEAVAHLTALEAAATPGPWRIAENGWVRGSNGFGVANYQQHVGMREEDARFIAAAVNVIPGLLAVVREQGDREAQLREQIASQIEAAKSEGWTYNPDADLRLGIERDAYDNAAAIARSGPSPQTEKRPQA